MTPSAVPALPAPSALASGLGGASIDGHQYREVTSFAQHTAWLQPIMKAYTTAGLLALCLLVALAWWLARRHNDQTAMTAIAWTAVGTGLCITAGLTLKQVFTEARPCLTIHVTTVQACPGATDYSFPSDHTTAAVALAAGIWLANRRLGTLAAILALIEGFSRIYLGQHYPHDILAAIALSTVIILAGWPLTRRPLTALLHALNRTPLRLLLTAESNELIPPAPHQDKLA